MTETEPQNPPAPDRSKGIYVLWGAGFAFLAVLGLVCWFVVRPILQVRAAAEELSGSIAHEILSSPERTAPLIARLGGPREAAGKLGFFLRLPKWTCRCPETRYGAAVLLAYCGKPALPELSLLLDSRDEDTKELALGAMLIYCLHNYPNFSSRGDLLPIPWIDESAPNADSAVKSIPSIDFTASMEAAARDEDPQVRETAAKALRIWKARLATISPRPY